MVGAGEIKIKAKLSLYWGLALAELGNENENNDLLGVAKITNSMIFFLILHSYRFKRKNIYYTIHTFLDIMA